MIQKDKIEFYEYLIFRNISQDINDIITSSISAAYKELSRTVTGVGKLNKKDHVFLHDSWENVLKKNILELINSNVDFDKWHEKIINNLKDIKIKSIQLNVGQAQKWVNLTLKYIYTRKPDLLNNRINELHIPIDSYIIDTLEKYKKSKIKWSKIKDYTLYLNIQEDFNIIHKDKGNSPLEREFKVWLEEMKKKSK